MAKRKSAENVDDFYHSIHDDKGKTAAKMIFGVLYVEIAKKIPFSKKIWAKRYCAIQNDELVIAKTQDTFDKKSNLRCNLRTAQGFKVMQNTLRTDLGKFCKKKIHNTTPLLEIIDKSGKKIRLNLANDDELQYWIEPLNRIFCKNAKSDEFDEPDAVALNSDIGDDGCRGQPTGGSSLAASPRGALQDERRRSEAEGFERRLNLRVEMLRARQKELQYLLRRQSMDIDEDKNGEISQKTGPQPVEHEYCSLECCPDQHLQNHKEPAYEEVKILDSRTVDDGFYEGANETTVYQTVPDMVVCGHSATTESGVAIRETTPDPSASNDGSTSSGSERSRSEGGGPSVVASPLLDPPQFSVPLYPLPFTKLDRPASVRPRPAADFCDQIDGFVADGGGSGCQNRGPFRPEDPPKTAASGREVIREKPRPLDRKNCDDVTLKDEKFNEAIQLDDRSHTSEGEKISAHNRKDEKVATMSANQGIQKGAPTRSSVSPHFYTSTPSMRQNPPPFKALLHGFYAAEPRRVQYGAVAATAPDGCAEETPENRRPHRHFALSPVSYVYDALSISCKLCRAGSGYE